MSSKQQLPANLLDQHRTSIIMDCDGLIAKVKYVTGGAEVFTPSLTAANVDAEMAIVINAIQGGSGIGNAVLDYEIEDGALKWVAIYNLVAVNFVAVRSSVGGEGTIRYFACIMTDDETPMYSKCLQWGFLPLHWVEI